METKHHKLARSVRPSDRDIKPTASQRDQLHTIVYRYPPTTSLSGEEQDLVWKFRFYLSSHKKALTKIIKCINWDTVSDVKHALSLLRNWAPMDVEDALELLNPTFTHPTVRQYAIMRLNQAPDEDLLLYLLQLVQALKYENFDEIFDAYKQIYDNLRYYCKAHHTAEHSSASQSMLSSTNPTEDSLDLNIPSVSSPIFDFSNSPSSESSNTMMSDTPCNLATFLIQRACQNPTLANYLYWYLSIECEDQETTRKDDEKVKEMYRTVLKMFLKVLSTGSQVLKTILINLKKQHILIDKLVDLVKTVAKESGNRKKKTEKFQQLLADPDAFDINFTNFEPRSFPLDPSVYIKKIIPQNVSLFKSALMPSK